MSMRDYEDLKDIEIPSVQKAMVKVMYDALKIADGKRKRAFNSMMSCILFKYARKLYEAGLTYTEEDVRYAYNDGYACGMEKGIEAERNRKG